MTLGRVAPRCAHRARHSSTSVRTRQEQTGPYSMWGEKGRTMDQYSVQSREIQAIVDTREGRVHNQDVGPLFGQLAILARELRHDAVTRGGYQEAVAAAVASDAWQHDGSAVVWTHLVVRVPQRQRRTTEELTSQYKQSRRHHGSRALFR